LGSVLAHDPGPKAGHRAGRGNGGPFELNGEGRLGRAWLKSVSGRRADRQARAERGANCLGAIRHIADVWTGARWAVVGGVRFWFQTDASRHAVMLKLTERASAGVGHTTAGGVGGSPTGPQPSWGRRAPAFPPRVRGARRLGISRTVPPKPGLERARLPLPGAGPRGFPYITHAAALAPRAIRRYGRVVGGRARRLGGMARRRPLFSTGRESQPPPRLRRRRHQGPGDAELSPPAREPNSGYAPAAERRRGLRGGPAYAREG